MISEEESANFDVFRDCLSTAIIEKLAPAGGKGTKKKRVKGRKREIKPVVREEEEDGRSDVAELAEFVEVRSWAWECNWFLVLSRRVAVVPRRRDFRRLTC